MTATELASVPWPDGQFADYLEWAKKNQPPMPEPPSWDN